MLNNIIDKLSINEKELKNFNIYKNDYYVTEKLFVKDNITYKIKITVDNQSLGYLFNDITENDMLYTLYSGQKIKYKNKTKNQMINLIKNIFKKEKR